MSLPPMINSSRLPLEILVVLHQHLTIARVTAAPSELFETEIKIVIQSNIKIVVVKFTSGVGAVGGAGAEAPSALGVVCVDHRAGWPQTCPSLVASRSSRWSTLSSGQCSRPAPL